MFNSQSLSRNGPLGAVWLAAYCHKRLKKVHVTQTDIPSSVDEMLLGELDVIAYRVFAYFLIGIVRIYSKKVEYLFKDCHKVLIEVKGFAVKEPNGSNTKDRTGRKSESHGLVRIPKRFELDAFDLEVVEEECSRGIDKPLEEITLRDHTWSDSRAGQFCSGLHHWQDLTACGHPSSLGHFPSEDVLPSEMAVDEVGRICDVVVDKVGKICDMVDDQEDRIPDQDVKEMSIETIRHCSPYQEEGSYLSTLVPFEEGFLNPNPLNKNRQVNSDKTGNMEGLLMEEEIFMEDVEPESIVGQKGRDFQEEREDDMPFNGAEEEPLELINSPGQGFVKISEMDKSPELLETGISIVTSPRQLLVDQATGPTKLETIPTPKVKEHVLKKRKRSCLCDDTIVLSNKDLRRNLADVSGLVCKRKTVPHNFFAVWRASRTRKDSILFSEPVISGMSPDLTSLFNVSLFNVHVIKTLEIQEGTFQEKETQEDGGFEKLNIMEYSGDGVPSVDPKGGLAPNTPARHPSSRRPSESPLVSNFDATRGESNENEQELDLQSNNEEIAPCDGDAQELNGTTERTRTVAKFLKRTFVKLKKGGEDEVVSLSKVLKGKTCRYCARLFYEILVLKSKDCIGVEQELPYDDIMIRKCPELENTFGI